MDKKKTSREQDFSLKSMERIKLKKNAKITKFDPTIKLKDMNFMAKALWQCLITGDTSSFKNLLKTHFEVINKSSLAKNKNISRRTIYRVLSEEGNPTLESVAKVVQAVYN